MYFWKQRLIFDQVKTPSQKRKGMLRDSALGWCIIHSFNLFFFFVFIYESVMKKKIRRGEMFQSWCGSSVSHNFRALKKEALFHHCLQPAMLTVIHNFQMYHLHHEWSCVAGRSVLASTMTSLHFSHCMTVLPARAQKYALTGRFDWQCKQMTSDFSRRLTRLRSTVSNSV